jgi:hypothetical protein
MSSYDRKVNWWHAVFVGILSGVLIGVYAFVISPMPDQGLVHGITPLFWASFITLPTTFMFGGQWKDVVPLILNAWFGYVVGLIVFACCGATMDAITLAGAFALFTCILTIVLQGLTSGSLPTWLGKTPMAFAGMVCCFASPSAVSLGQATFLGNPSAPSLVVAITALISLLVGVIGATCMAQTRSWAVKICGKNPAEAQEDSADR